MARILMFSNLKGGVKTFTSYLSNALKNNGYEVEVFYLTQPNFSLIKNLFTKNKKNYDIIHTNYAITYPFIYLAKRFSIPIVETVHGVPQPWLEPKIQYKIGYCLESNFLKTASKEADVVISVSNFVKRKLLEHYQIKSKVIYNGIDLSKVVILNENQKEEFKKKLGFSRTEKIILFVGRMHPCKNPVILIKAYIHLRKYLDNVKLLMIGYGELTKRIKKIIQKLNLKKHVHIYSRVKKRFLQVFYNISDIFVLPSITEAFGYTTLEAMAHGLPPIVSSAGASPEIVGNAGLYFDPLDSEELTDKLLHVLLDNEIHRKLSNIAQKRARLFSITEMARKYIQEYKKLA